MAGSPPITQLREAAGLPQPSVSATISGHGQNMQLQYRLVPLPGQNVAFVERGAKEDRFLGKATGANGTVAFGAGDGPAGRRQVFAVVTQDGRPRADIALAGYDASNPSPLGAPVSVTVARNGCALQLSWQPVPGSTLTTVTTRTTDGRMMLTVVRVGGHTTSVATVHGVCATGADVLLAARRSSGDKGPTVTVHVAAQTNAGSSDTLVVVLVIVAGVAIAALIAVAIVHRRRRVASPLLGPSPLSGPGAPGRAWRNGTTGAGVTGPNAAAEPASGVGEPRWPMALAVLATGLLRAALPPQLHNGDARWVFLAVVVVLLVALIVGDPGRIDREKRWLHVLTVIMIGAISLANASAAVRLVVSIINTSPFTNNAKVLLASGGAIWLTNVIAFGLWYWELDRGGPAARARGSAVRPALVFPEMINAQHVAEGWYPRFVDYLHFSFATGTAFSPTDVSAIKPWAKLMMMAEEAISLVVAILVVARAVNILK